MKRPVKRVRMSTTFPKALAEEIQTLANADRRSFNSMLNILVEQVLYQLNELRR